MADSSLLVGITGVFPSKIQGQRPWQSQELFRAVFFTSTSNVCCFELAKFRNV